MLKDTKEQITRMKGEVSKFLLDFDIFPDTTVDKSPLAMLSFPDRWHNYWILVSVFPSSSCCSGFVSSLNDRLERESRLSKFHRHKRTFTTLAPTCTAWRWLQGSFRLKVDGKFDTSTNKGYTALHGCTLTGFLLDELGFLLGGLPLLVVFTALPDRFDLLALRGVFLPCLEDGRFLEFDLPWRNNKVARVGQVMISRDLDGFLVTMVLKEESSCRHKVLSVNELRTLWTFSSALSRCHLLVMHLSMIRVKSSEESECEKFHYLSRDLYSYHGTRLLKIHYWLSMPVIAEGLKVRLYAATNGKIRNYPLITPKKSMLMTVRFHPMPWSSGPIDFLQIYQNESSFTQSTDGCTGNHYRVFNSAIAFWICLRVFSFE